MIDISKTRPELTRELPLSMYVGTVEEGMAMQWVMEGGINKITIGSGAASTNIFAGMAWSYYTNPTTAPTVETPTIDPTVYTVTTTQIPTGAGVVSVVLNGVQFTQVGSAPSTTQYIISGQTLTFNSANAGLVPTVTYIYTLSAAQAQALIGEGYGTVKATDITGTCGIVEKGLVYTSNYDTSKNWGATDIANITVAANGVFTIGGGGAPVNAVVQEVPSSSSALLGLYIK